MESKFRPHSRMTNGELYIWRQTQEMEADRKEWEYLASLRDDVKAFYKAYSSYLEAKNVVSERRKLLIEMAKKVVQKLEGTGIGGT